MLFLAWPRAESVAWRVKVLYRRGLARRRLAQQLDEAENLRLAEETEKQ